MPTKNSHNCLKSSIDTVALQFLQAPVKSSLG